MLYAGEKSGAAGEAECKLCQAMGLTSSHQNEVVMSVYKDLGTKPVDHTMHELLHTHYYPRTMLATLEAEHV